MRQDCGRPRGRGHGSPQKRPRETKGPERTDRRSVEWTVARVGSPVFRQGVMYRSEDNHSGMPRVPHVSSNVDRQVRVSSMEVSISGKPNRR